MSHSFINPKNNYYNVNTDSDIPQKKIDPIAQLKWLNTPQVYGGWGLFNNLPADKQGSLPAQMFAQDENLYAGSKAEEEKSIQARLEKEDLKMNSDKVISSADREEVKRGYKGAKTNMPADVREKMENSFGTDFSGVSIHQNSEQASNIGALAYTQGNDVYFAPGQYNPGSTKGQELLGHELTHVIQQRQGRVKVTKQGKGFQINDNPALEKEADKIGANVAQAKGNGIDNLEYQSGNLGNEFGDPPIIMARIGCTIGTGGVRLNLNFTIDKKYGDFTASYGFGVTYHSNFYTTGKKGWEMRNSFMLDYNTNKFGASLGTNFWTGLGEMKEFNQRTGMMNLRSGKVGFTYENDGFPFGYIGLGDKGDSYRTAAASIQVGDFSLNANLITGLRDATSFLKEQNLPGGLMGVPLEGKGEFGEKYTHGFVFEQGTPYRYGGLTLNYKGTSIGINSDRYVRHPFQNILAHDWIKDQRQFKVLSGDIKAVINSSNFGLSKFTTWGQ